MAILIDHSSAALAALEASWSFFTCSDDLHLTLPLRVSIVALLLTALQVGDFAMTDGGVTKVKWCGQRLDVDKRKDMVFLCQVKRDETRGARFKVGGVREVEGVAIVVVGRTLSNARLCRVK